MLVPPDFAALHPGYEASAIAPEGGNAGTCVSHRAPQQGGQAMLFDPSLAAPCCPHAPQFFTMPGHRGNKVNVEKVARGWRAEIGGQAQGDEARICGIIFSNDSCRAILPQCGARRSPSMWGGEASGEFAGPQVSTGRFPSEIGFELVARNSTGRISIRPSRRPARIGLRHRDSRLPIWGLTDPVACRSSSTPICRRSRRPEPCYAFGQAIARSGQRGSGSRP